MAERHSSLFPNKKVRPKSNGMNNIQKFNDTLQEKSIQKKANIQPEKSIVKQKELKNPNKSHKGKAGRKAEYNDPRLKKDQNTKVSISTKLRIQRLISRKFDNKSEGDVIDLALDYLVSSFDRDDRDSLYKAYKEDMKSVIPTIEKKNAIAKEKGIPYLPITPEIEEETLEIQKSKWVSPKLD
ncbi:hypothetical protein D922_00022 [Enterococcus faecalis 06-MB-DW-09]|nr:hypothetical protein D922_00022 [Enterococcus faecalis 06-MB-DW-09]MBO1123685.1 hypothetical protein [Enterococcus casseliflavus]